MPIMVIPFVPGLILICLGGVGLGFFSGMNWARWCVFIPVALLFLCLFGDAGDRFDPQHTMVPGLIGSALGVFLAWLLCSIPTKRRARRDRALNGLSFFD